MKLFIRYILITIVGVALLDIASRPLFNFVFSNLPKNSWAWRDMSYMTNEEQSDILVLGASRASHHYNSQMLIDSLGKTCFNIGQDGLPVYINYLDLIRSLKNGKIETVILDLSPAQVTDQWMEEKISTLTPYYWKNDSARAVVDYVSQHGNISKYLYLSSFVQYNSRAYTFINYLHPHFVEHQHGYIPLPYRGWQVKRNYIPQKSFQINEKAVVYLNKIIGLCRSKGIELTIVASPCLSDMSLFTSYMSDFCKERQVQFLDYSSDEKYVDNPYLWKDAGHMNCKGADMFTEEIIKALF